jgi:hypothetical protein
VIAYEEGKTVRDQLGLWLRASRIRRELASCGVTLPDQLGDGRQRAVRLAFEEQAARHHIHDMRATVPVAKQASAKHKTSALDRLADHRADRWFHAGSSVAALCRHMRAAA